MQREDTTEDQQLEVSPFVVVAEEAAGGTEQLEVVRSVYTRNHFLTLIRPNHAYLGHGTSIINSFSGNLFTNYQTMGGEIPIQTVVDVPLNVQTIAQHPSPIGELLSLPDYIMSKISEMIESLSTDPDVMRENRERFFRNNLWTIRSMDGTETLSMIFPMFSIDSYRSIYILKFLRYDRGVIQPYIYSIPLNMPNNQMTNLRISTDIGGLTKNYDLFLSVTPTGPGLDCVLYDPPSMISKKLVVAINNPNDCVVIALYLAGLLPQPDMTRYHNLFRTMQKVDSLGTFNHILSYGSDDFIRQIISERVLNFYNREDPVHPLEQLNLIYIYLPRAYNTDLTSYPSHTRNGFRIYQSSSHTYHMPGYDEQQPSQYVQYLNNILDNFGCNQPNSIILIGINGHQLVLYHDGYEYYMHDPQMQKYYRLNNMDHPNLQAATEPYIALYAIYTNNPARRRLHVPEFATLYEYNRSPSSFSGDIYPIVNQAISRFVVEKSRNIDYELDTTRQVSPTFHLYVNNPLQAYIENGDSLLRPFLSLSRSQRGIIPELIASLSNFTENKLSLLSDYKPEISFTRVVRVEGCIERAISNMTGDVILLLSSCQRKFSGINPNFIPSRLAFFSLMRELVLLSIVSIQEVEAFVDGFLQKNQEKQILRIGDNFREVMRLAEKDQIKSVIISYLSSLKTKRLSEVVTLVRMVNVDKPADLVSKLYSSLKTIVAVRRSSLKRKATRNARNLHNKIEYLASISAGNHIDEIQREVLLLDPQHRLVSPELILEANASIRRDIFSPPQEHQPVEFEYKEEERVSFAYIIRAIESLLDYLPAASLEDDGVGIPVQLYALELKRLLKEERGNEDDARKVFSLILNLVKENSEALSKRYLGSRW